MNNREEVINELRGIDFVPINIVASALYDGWNRLDVAAALYKVLKDESIKLKQLTPFGCPENASEEAKTWAINYLKKCAQKPRLISANRVKPVVGWMGKDIANNKYFLALCPTPQEQCIAWHDATLDAAFWLERNKITPHEAATLLCRQNPLDDSNDPLLISTDETTPADFKRLLRVFQDENCEGQALLEWLDVAKSSNLKYHSWIDEYLAASSGQLPSATKEAAGQKGAKPMPAQRLQEREILRIIGELGYVAKALRKDVPGIKGVKDEVRNKLQLSTKVFDKAWERLSSAGDICKLK